MKIKICTPVIGETLKEFLINLDQVQKVSEMVELRVDDIKNLNDKDLQLVRKKTVKKAILTSRKKEVILKALNLGFNFVDIDISLISKLNLSKQMKTKIVLSFHNFKKTPTIKELSEIVDNMRKFKVVAIKIATMVKNDEDLGNLFRVLMNKKKNEKMIVVGMGEEGKLVRILGPLLGSFLTFASTQFGSSARGQIDIENMKNIYKLLVSNP